MVRVGGGFLPLTEFLVRIMWEEGLDEGEMKPNAYKCKSGHSLDRYRHKDKTIVCLLCKK